MLLALDIGNSSAKYGLFSGMQLLQAGVLRSPAELLQLVQEKGITRIMAASVAADPEQYRQAVQQQVNEFIVLTPDTPVPVQKQYDSPLTLGADRLAAVVGASYLFQGQPVLVIDAGTCITTDLLLADGIYLGGSISPGIGMRFRALHTFTARLPLVHRGSDLVGLTGTSTEGSIRSGVLNGTVAELQGVVRHYRQQHRGLVTVLCGGDSQFFETKLDSPIFVVPELVLIGLARILQPSDV